MPFLKLASKIDATCSFEKDGMKCGTSYKKGDEYIFDTEGKKGYCPNHQEINNKIVIPQSKSGGYGGKSFGAPLCRTPDEALQAVKIWHEVVMPMIMETARKITGNGSVPDGILLETTRTYEEIFLGKHTPSQIAK